MSKPILREADKSLNRYLVSFSSMMGRHRGAADKGYYYDSLYDFAVKECKTYQPVKMTKEEKEHVEGNIKRLGFTPQVKQCFYNSQLLAVHDDSERIKYVEGYGLSMIPTMHGWCEINGKVIDLTWKKENGAYVLGIFRRRTSVCRGYIPDRVCTQIYA